MVSMRSFFSQWKMRQRASTRRKSSYASRRRTLPLRLEWLEPRALLSVSAGVDESLLPNDDAPFASTGVDLGSAYAEGARAAADVADPGPGAEGQVAAASYGPTGVAAFIDPGGHLRVIYEEYQTFLAGGGQPKDFVSVRDGFALYEDKIYVEIDGTESLPPILDSLGFETLNVDRFCPKGQVMIQGYLPLRLYPPIISAEGLTAINATLKHAVRQPPPGVTDPPADPGNDASTGVADHIDPTGDLRGIYEEYQAFLGGGGQPEDFVSVRDNDLALYEDKIYVELDGSDSLPLILDGLGFETLNVTGHPYFPKGKVMVEGYLPLGQYLAIISAEGLTAISVPPKCVVHQLPPGVTAPPADPGNDAPTGVADHIDPTGDLRGIYEEYQAFLGGGGQPEDFVSVGDALFTLYQDKIHVELYGSDSLLPILDGLGFEALDVPGNPMLYEGIVVVEGYLPLGQYPAIVSAEGLSGIDAMMRDAVYRSPTGVTDRPVRVDEPVSLSLFVPVLLFQSGEAIGSFMADTPINDLEADDDWLRLSSDDLVDFVIYIEGLNNQADLANAYSQNGGNDTKGINGPGLLDDLDLYGPWS